MIFYLLFIFNYIQVLIVFKKVKPFIYIGYKIAMIKEIERQSYVSFSPMNPGSGSQTASIMSNISDK